MTLEETFRKIAADLGASFMFDTPSRQNIKGDKTEFPLIALNYPRVGKEDVNFKQRYRVYWDCILFFVEKCPFDFDTGKEIEPTTKRMMKLWFDFRQELVKSSNMFELGQVEFQEVADKFDVNVAGIAVYVRVREALEYCR